MVVDTVAKFSKGGPKTAPVLPNFKSDATKVTSKGMGLKKAFLGKQNQFTVNASEAGKFLLLHKKHFIVPRFPTSTKKKLSPVNNKLLFLF